MKKALARELDFVRSNRKSGGKARLKRYDELMQQASNVAAREREIQHVRDRAAPQLAGLPTGQRQLLLLPHCLPA